MEAQLIQEIVVALLLRLYRVFRFLSFENIEGNGPLKPELSIYLLLKH